MMETKEKKKNISITLPPSMIEKVDSLAYHYNRSKSDVIETCVKPELERQYEKMNSMPGGRGRGKLEPCTRSRDDVYNEMIRFLVSELVLHAGKPPLHDFNIELATILTVFNEMVLHTTSTDEKKAYAERVRALLREIRVFLADV